MKKLLFLSFLFAAIAATAQTKPSEMSKYHWRLYVCQEGIEKKVDCHELIQRPNGDYVACFVVIDVANFGMPINKSIVYKERDVIRYTALR